MPRDTNIFILVVTTAGQNILILLINEYYKVMVSYFSESEFTDGQFRVSLLSGSIMQTFCNNIAMSNGLLADQDSKEPLMLVE